MIHPKQPFLETPERLLIRQEPNELRAKREEYSWLVDVACSFESVFEHSRFKSNTVWGDLLLRTNRQLHAHLEVMEKEIEGIEREVGNDRERHH